MGEVYNIEQNSYGLVAGRTAGFYISAGAVFVSTLVILAVLSSSAASGDPLSFDMSRGRWIVMALSAAVLCLSVAFMHHYAKACRPADSCAEMVADPGQSSSELGGEAGAVDEEAILAALSEDERRLYLMISEAGGELLQMHLVSSGTFSKAKVTRLLDKLEGRRLVVRERHGMTNRVRLIR